MIFGNFAFGPGGVCLRQRRLVARLDAFGELREPFPLRGLLRLNGILHWTRLHLVPLEYVLQVLQVAARNRLRPFFRIQRLGRWRNVLLRAWERRQARPDLLRRSRFGNRVGTFGTGGKRGGCSRRFRRGFATRPLNQTQRIRSLGRLRGLRLRRYQIIKQSGRFRLGFRQLQHRTYRRGPIGNTRFQRHPPPGILQQPRPGVFFRLLLDKLGCRAGSGNQSLNNRARQGFIQHAFKGWLAFDNQVLRPALRTFLQPAGNKVSNQLPAQTQPGQHADRFIRIRKVFSQNSSHAQPRLDQAGNRGVA